MKRSLQIAGTLFGGLSLSWLVWLLAVRMSGGGHGWNSSAISALSVLALPLTGAGFVFYRSRAGWVIATYVTFAAAVLDVILLWTTGAEGWGYVEKVWEHVPSVLTAWVVIWTAWHVTIAMLWRRLVRRVGVARGVGPKPL